MKRKMMYILMTSMLLCGCAGTSQGSHGGTSPGPQNTPDPDKAPLLVKEEYKDAQMSYTKEYTYDEEKKLVKTVFTASTGETDITDYTYDSQGRILMETVQSSGSYDEGDSVKEYVYEKDGGYTRTDTYSTGIREEHVYDRYGNETKMVSAYDGGEFIQRYEYELDAEGRPLHITTYSYDTVMSEQFYEYNERGEEILMRTETDTGQEAGKLVSEIRTDYTYDSRGLVLTKTKYDPDDKENSAVTTEYTYNDFWQIVKEVTTDPYGNTNTIVRTY